MKYRAVRVIGFHAENPRDLYHRLTLLVEFPGAMADRLGSFMPLLNSREDGPTVRVFGRADQKSLLVEFVSSGINSKQAFAKSRALAWMTHRYVVCSEDIKTGQILECDYEDGVKIPADFLPALADV